ncbi:beta-galactosidase [Asticcacaulis sp. BYS171W]|uniref:Beta-galactosidase n=1 Tax=Asticcacaulis aquaticus TaxID=2984212 RepID=A0ABT5HVA6_9CAUL|nr:beta-galactosidase [Asticcacaulis aquaticus]MDC7683780.1 beta-galactosidase [Asticcacaulis aquaticus]
MPFQCLRMMTIAGVVAAMVAVCPASAQPVPAAPKLDTILYGASYYNEYVPAPIRSERLKKDVAMMKAAGFTVVRMGESSWGRWEPADGQFDYGWMDEVVAAFGKAGIKVIMGTPTYSIPVWMYARHPDMLARPLNGGDTGYGMRQNMNIDDANYRRYAERIIVNLATHYKNNPTVIGWQVDNETSAYGSSNASVHAEFVDWLRAKYKTTAALNEAWLLNYWGQQVDTWDNFPTRDFANSTSYKLEWQRFQQWRATRFVGWQADLVRRNARADQFIIQNNASFSRAEVNAYEMAKPLNVASNDIYFNWQDEYDGRHQTLQGNMARSAKQRNYFVAETTGQAQGWDATKQVPPYDGQMYQDVFANIGNGANAHLYWHWASLNAGQEIYWKGVLGHDFEPNRAYAEVSRVGNDLKRIGSKLVDLKKDNAVAVLYSTDSYNALTFMPIDKWSKPLPPSFHTDAYRRTFERVHAALYRAHVETDIVFADAPDFSKYKLLIVPALYVADDALLGKISDYVKGGGHVLMTFKSGEANENFVVRWQTAPGPLRAAAGFRYQETSTLLKPLKLKGDPFGVGDKNEVDTIAEFLHLETAEALAWYDHPFFGKYPAVTRNSYGKGTLLYQGTELTDDLQLAVVRAELKRIGLYGPDQDLPEKVQVKHATSKAGKKLHFYYNYSTAPVSVTYAYKPATELLGGAKVATGQAIELQPWGVAILEE